MVLLTLVDRETDTLEKGGAPIDCGGLPRFSTPFIDAEASLVNLFKGYRLSDGSLTKVKVLYGGKSGAFSDG